MLAGPCIGIKRQGYPLFYECNTAKVGLSCTRSYLLRKRMPEVSIQTREKHKFFGCQPENTVPTMRFVQHRGLCHSILTHAASKQANLPILITRITVTLPGRALVLMALK